LTFWFDEIDRNTHFAQSKDLDDEIRWRFEGLHRRAARCELWSWRTSPSGRLAEIIVLDQFSRNLFRNRAEAFANDGTALALAQEAVALKHDQLLPKRQRSFLYMPYMHSESAPVHIEALRLFTDLGDDAQLRYEVQHKEIIDRFGRYPHRNGLLGRLSSSEEEAFLQQPNSGF
jgi:uncharacterized protein (DUF924 family)